jgi:hypothetical protein
MPTKEQAPSSSFPPSVLMKHKPCSPFTLNHTLFVNLLQFIRRTISAFYSTSSIPCPNGAALKKIGRDRNGFNAHISASYETKPLPIYT